MERVISMSYPRVNRISEEVKKLVSYIIRNELQDPRISKMTSVLDVEVTKDLRYATVYVSVFGDEKEKEETIQALKHSSGYVRREIGRNIKMRYTPEIIFKLDNSIERGIYMANMISKVNENITVDKPSESDEDNEDE